MSPITVTISKAENALPPLNYYSVIWDALNEQKVEQGGFVLIEAADVITLNIPTGGLDLEDLIENFDSYLHQLSRTMIRGEVNGISFTTALLDSIHEDDGLDYRVKLNATAKAVLLRGSKAYYQVFAVLPSMQEAA